MAEVVGDRSDGMFHPCSLCRSYFRDVPTWFSHIRLVHGNDPDFSMQCGIDGCSKVFKTFSGLNTHVYRHHRDIICKDPVNVPPNIDTVASETPDNDGNCANHHPNIGDDVDESRAHVMETSMEAHIAQLLAEDEEEQKKAAALFLLEMREKFSISQVAINGIVTGCEKLFHHVKERIEAGVMHHLSNSGVDTEMLPDVKAFFNDLQSPFIGLGSDFLQHKYYRDQFGLIVS